MQIINSININDEENNVFLKSLLEGLLSKGLGVPSKHEADLLLFNLLMEHTDLKDKSTFELSLVLKQPESRIKNLKYECELKYGVYNEETFKNSFMEVLKRSKYDVDKKQVTFSVDDKFLRLAIQNKLKKIGAYADSSFNTEIVKISNDSFIELLKNQYNPADVKSFEKEFNKKRKKGEEISFKELFKKYLEGAANAAGKKTIDLIAMGITGGTSELPALIEKISGVIGGMGKATVEPEAID